MEKKITIAIPTYNRLDILKTMAKSLYASNLASNHNIRIYDDCSTEYDEVILKELFPTAASIIRNPQNVKADANMYLMYKNFCDNTTDDFFFNADSDLIFSFDWLKYSLELIEETDGILSVFNTDAHAVTQLVNDELCIKKHIGAAGTLFKRQRVEEIIAHFPIPQHSFDWKWCSFFNEQNLSVFCSNRSFVQHIGYKGQNSECSFLQYDYGKNFIVDGIDNGQVINDVFENFLDINRHSLQDLVALRQMQTAVFECIKQKRLGTKFVKECIKALLKRKLNIK